MAQRLVRHLLRGWKAAAVVAALVVLGLALADGYVEDAARSVIFSEVGQTPAVDAALVLGTSKYTVAGTVNRFYQSRITAAAALFKAGKVRGIVVSGDNATTKYNEPQRMKEDLVAMGVPGEYVTCDYAGFRTLDSVVRMREVFGFDRYTIVSQGFHVARALFIARAYGHDPVGFATEGEDEESLKLRTREVLARAIAVFDAILWKRSPKFLGDPVLVKLAPVAAGER